MRLRASLFATVLAASGLSAWSGSASGSQPSASARRALWPLVISGKVIHVADGDTLAILDASKARYTIRLTDIDAPESAHGQRRPGQPFSGVATAHLKALALGKEAQAVCYDVDRRVREDGAESLRFICRVNVNSQDLSFEMLGSGLAFANRQHRSYVRDPRAFGIEAEAKAAGRGLWREPAPIEPWVWRKRCWQAGEC